MKKIALGLIGFGVVGEGVVKTLQEKATVLSRMAGARLWIKAVCDKDLRRRRKVKLPAGLLTSDVKRLLLDPEIKIIVELIGGIHPAREFILEALRRGKYVVTANKALLAERGVEVFRQALRYNKDVGFEASVCAGIPIIKTLRESLLANAMDTLLGIVNGTSNFILTAMSQKGLSFSEALLEAKHRGYAERNPSLDILGFDAAHKLSILTLLAFGKGVKISDIMVEGISDISINDIHYARELGYVIKPLAIAKLRNGYIEARVHPTLLSFEHPLSNIHGVYNGVYIHGDMVGRMLFYGRGAGQGPAASAVVSDIVGLARRLQGEAGTVAPFNPSLRHVKGMRRLDDIKVRYYVRFSAIDKPGVLAKISGILGRYNISIASVVQKERKKAKIVPLVMMTHEVRERDMRKALQKIDLLPLVRRKTIAIRVESVDQ